LDHRERQCDRDRRDRRCRYRDRGGRQQVFGAGIEAGEDDRFSQA
jgi:hypothetical protein